MTSNLKFTGFDAVPDHMERFGMIAKESGLSRGALLRLLIARFVRRTATAKGKTLSRK